MKKEELLKAEYNGQIDLNGINITCAVLEDGTRVLSERSLSNALGVKGGGAHWQKKKQSDESAYLPEYVSANYLKPFIDDKIKAKLKAPIKYVSKSGAIANGALAEVLPEVCHIWITAKKNGALKAKTQIQIADNAYTILRGFAHIGIIALIDEATGYQYQRERDELQKILKKYISEELMPWQKKFPDIYYKELFRLNGWDFTVSGIKNRRSYWDLDKQINL